MTPPEFRRMPIPDNEFTVDHEEQPTMWSAHAPKSQPAPGQHPTEVRCPEQCAEFRRILEEMYVVHLQKNQDYSPHNIGATGNVGLVTRLWDKMARLMSLTGFDIKTGDYRAPLVGPVNEPIEDTLIDLANYAVIARIWRAGKWGK